MYSDTVTFYKHMKLKDRIIIVIIVAILVGAVILAIVNSSRAPSIPTAIDIATSTMTASSTPTLLAFDRNVTDGIIRVSYPSTDFVLATTAAAVLVHAYIPPCDEGFLYCIYYDGTKYVGTNFEAAGLTVKKRADLTSATSCLATSPYGSGSTLAPDMQRSTDNYSWSVFLNVGDAGAGHYASGSLYRLYISGFANSNNSKMPQKPLVPKCYEFMTRIGQTQFANYPAGTKIEFTTRDQSIVQASLKQIIDNISLMSGDKLLFQ